MSNSLSLSLSLPLSLQTPESPHVGSISADLSPPPEHAQLELGLQKAEFPLKGILAFLGGLLSGMMLLPM